MSKYLRTKLLMAMQTKLSIEGMSLITVSGLLSVVHSFYLHGCQRFGQTPATTVADLQKQIQHMNKANEI